MPLQNAVAERIIMTLDKKTVDMLLSLDDQRLSFIIKKLAEDAGIPKNSINPSANELNGIRSALSMATDSDILRASELIEKYKSGKKE